MLSNVKFVVNGDNIFSYELDGDKRYFTCSDIADYWGYCYVDPESEDEYRRTVDIADMGGNLSWFKELNLICGVLTAASDQTGIVFVWDAAKEKIIHASDGDYAQSVALLDDFLYVNFFVHHYLRCDTPYIAKIPLGGKEYEKVNVNIPKEAFKESVGALSVIKGKIYLVFEEQKYLVAE